MSVRERGSKSFLAAVLKRTGKPRKLTDREGRKKKRPTAYVSTGGPADDAAIGGGTGGGGGAGGGT